MRHPTSAEALAARSRGRLNGGIEGGPGPVPPSLPAVAVREYGARADVRDGMNTIAKLFSSARTNHARRSNEWVRRMECPSVRRRYSGT
jgi:hypothetical protein